LSKKLKLESGRKYKIGLASKLIDLSTERIRQISENEKFGLVIEKTSGGHRLFTKEQIEIVLAIHNKYQDNWDEDQISSWLKGMGPETFVSHQPTPAVEMDIEELKRLYIEQAKELEDVKKVVKDQQEVISGFKQLLDNDPDAYFQKQIALHFEKNKDQIVTATIRGIQEEKKRKALEEYEENKNKKPEGIFPKLFNKLFSK
jgi:DNA-binding transcriptional MerR regulator